MSDTKKRHKTEFATTNCFHSWLLHGTGTGWVTSSLSGDRRYFNGNNFNSTSDPGFVAMTSQWPPPHTGAGIKSSRAVTFMPHSFSLILAPKGAQVMLICSFVCQIQTCQELSIFIFLAQIFKLLSQVYFSPL